MVIVRHTPAERALYLGQAHEAPDFHSMRRALKENSAESHEKLECLHPKFLLAEARRHSNRRTVQQRIRGTDMLRDLLREFRSVS